MNVEWADLLGFASIPGGISFAVWLNKKRLQAQKESAEGKAYREVLEILQEREKTSWQRDQNSWAEARHALLLTINDLRARVAHMENLEMTYLTRIEELKDTVRRVQHERITGREPQREPEQNIPIIGSNFL